MDAQTIETLISAGLLIATVVAGFFSAYLKEKTALTEKAAEAIAEAEEEYRDVSKAGGQKFEWCVNKLYGLVPVALKPVFTKEIIGTIVQNTFDSIERYAKVLLDKAVDKVVK